MRIRIQCDREVVCRALSDLVREAGHELVGSAEDLRILVGGAGAPDERTPTLWLQAPPGRVPDPEPSPALERVLTSGGLATWPEPFEPSLLLDLLRASPSRPAGPDVPTYALIAVAPDPWLFVDPARAKVLWANVAARKAFGLVETDLAAELRGGALGRLRPVLDRREGRDRLEIDGRTWFAAWWTDGHGTRVLGLFEMPRPGQTPDPNLRTLAELGRISATLAHEIRSPVASFAGAIDLLEDDLPPAERSEVVTLARARVEQMRGLLDATLRLAHPFKGPPGPLDCAEVARSAIEEVRTDPLLAGIEFRLDVQQQPVHALGYEQPLQQALTNLLRNAAQAQGGAGRVTVEVARTPARAVLRVCDDGPGISPEQRERIFEPFWTTKPTGTGLGLVYVRRVVEATGGEVQLEDADRGAVFRIDLPLAPAE
jgi:signal transduction histidine kinase